MHKTMGLPNVAIEEPVSGTITVRSQDGADLGFLTVEELIQLCITVSMRYEKIYLED